jgi:hypothetical protein
VKLQSIHLNHPEVDVSIELQNVNATSPVTSGHRWHIHANRARVSSCATAKGHYDPTNKEIDLDGDGQVSAAEYTCNSTDPGSCYSGDLSGKHGQVATDGVPVGGSDTGLSLAELIDRRSVVVHAANGGAPRLMCGNIRAGAWNDSIPALLPVDSVATWHTDGSLQITQCPIGSDPALGSMCDNQTRARDRRVLLDISPQYAASRHAFSHVTNRSTLRNGTNLPRNSSRRLQSQGLQSQDCVQEWSGWRGGCGCSGQGTQTRRFETRQQPSGSGAACVPAPPPQTRQCNQLPDTSGYGCSGSWAGWSRCTTADHAANPCSQSRDWRVRQPGGCVPGAACPTTPTPGQTVPPNGAANREWRSCGCCGEWREGPCRCTTNSNGDVIGRRNRTYRVLHGGPYSAANPGNCEAAHGTTEQQSCDVGNECCVNKLVPQFHTADYRRPPCPVDCVGSWGCWSKCSAGCGGGVQVRRFTQTQAAKYGGAECVAPDDAVQVRYCIGWPWAVVLCTATH